MAQKTTLLILAAGMGSRYGGLKQMDALGPNGETIIDYSIHDAIEAGFDKIVFIIRDSFSEAFKAHFEPHYGHRAELLYVNQEINTPIEGMTDFPDREKPWGTAHAVLVAQHVVKEPFAVINADDYYGKSAFADMHRFLNERLATDLYSMMGYQLSNTLSDHGFVSRGVCEVDDDGFLLEVVERTKVQRMDGHILFESDSDQNIRLEEDAVVSMNFWGFHPNIFPELKRYFIEFANDNRDKPKAEFFIPLIVDDLIQSETIRLEVMTSKDRWYGVTYAEDKDPVMAAFEQMIADGKYPQNLWI